MLQISSSFSLALSPQVSRAHMQVKPPAPLACDSTSRFRPGSNAVAARGNSFSSCQHQRGAPLTRTARLNSTNGVRSTCRHVSRRAVTTAAAGGGDMRVSSFAKEMERVAAKEALLLAIKDAGGVESLSTGQGNAAGKIQVSERVVALERLNPTTRPTSSPLLEGYWDFVWAGAGSPGLIAARLVLQRLPPQVASLQALQLHIMPGSTITATAVVRFLNVAETNVIIKSKLEMEASLKLKEEYAEIEVTTPIVTGGSIPAPLTAIVDQLSSLLKSLPAALQDTINAGLRVPLDGRYSRELLVSYLDDELMVARDEAGLVDVLVRADSEGWVGRSDDEGGVNSFTDDPTDYIS